MGTFTPSLDRNGEVSINFRADMAFKNGMNGVGAYTGVIANKERIGWTNEQYKEAWDAEHPDHLLEIPAA